MMIDSENGYWIITDIQTETSFNANNDTDENICYLLNTIKVTEDSLHLIEAGGIYTMSFEGQRIPKTYYINVTSESEYDRIKGIVLD